MRIDEIIDPKSYEINSSEYSGLPLEEAKEILRTRCQKGLHAMKLADRLLYRGVRHREDIFVGSSPHDRDPRNTDKGTQYEVDKLLDRSGFSTLRSNSIFCTGRRTAAAYYGPTYAIFPYDGFKFLWSKRIVDLFDSPIASGATYYGLIPKPLKSLDKMSPAEFVKHYGFTNKNLPSAIQSGHEILIHGDYLAIKYEIVMLKDLLKGIL